jgi:bifunctional DNase/RNase
MPAATDVGFIEMRIGTVVAFGPPLAKDGFECVVLDEVSGDRHLVIQIGATEAFWLGARLQGVQFGRPMTYQLAAVLVQELGGQVRRVRIDRLVDGAYGATVEIEGPLGVRFVDARPSDALNLGAIAGAPVFVGTQLVEDGERRQEADSEDAWFLRHALTAPPMKIMKAENKTAGE